MRDKDSVPVKKDEEAAETASGIKLRRLEKIRKKQGRKVQGLRVRWVERNKGLKEARA